MPYVFLFSSIVRLSILWGSRTRPDRLGLASGTDHSHARCSDQTLQRDLTSEGHRDQMLGSASILTIPTKVGRPSRPLGVSTPTDQIELGRAPGVVEDD